MVEVENEVMDRSTLFSNVRKDWENLKKGSLPCVRTLVTR